MFDISKYYDLGKLEFIGNQEDFINALRNEAIHYTHRWGRYNHYQIHNVGNVNIILDNINKPSKVYGANYIKIIKEIKKLGKRLDGIKHGTDKHPALIDQINEKIKEVEQVKDNEELLKPKLRELRGLCSESINEEDNPYGDILDSIKRKINSINLICYIKGTYNHITNTITLYLRNIFVYENESDNVDDLLATLIHETVHLIHFECLDLFKVKVKDNIKHDIILESYASYLEYIYLHDRLGNYTLCDELYDSWEKYDFMYFPYSGALYLYGGYYKYCNYIDVRRLLEPADRLFNDSLISMDIAFEDMIMFKRLYEINRHYGRIII